MSTDDQSTPTPMAVERRHVLMPAAALADLLGAGFYLPRTAEILDSYGGWTTGAKQEADSLPARIHDDYLRNCQNSRRAEIHERVLSAAYIPQARVFRSVVLRDYRERLSVSEFWNKVPLSTASRGGTKKTALRVASHCW